MGYVYDDETRANAKSALKSVCNWGLNLLIATVIASMFVGHYFFSWLLEPHYR